MVSRGLIERALATAAAYRSQNDAPVHTRQQNVEDSTQIGLTKTRRQQHLISTVAQHLSVLKWMTEEVIHFVDTQISSKTLQDSLSLLSESYKPGVGKFSTVGRENVSISVFVVKGFGRAVARHLQGARKRYNFKAIPYRARKQSLWAAALYRDLGIEFDDLRAASIKMTLAVLLTIAIALVQDAYDQKPYHQSANSNNKNASAKYHRGGLSILW